MENLEICYLPVVEMVEAVKSKKLSPVEIMDAVLSRIERLNPEINAYCTLVADSARQQAKEAEARVMKGEITGPLHGIPVSIKDLLFTRGIRTTGGSRIYQDFVPEQDAIIVERLKAAGAIVVGKTNTSEFGWTAITDNRLFGATRNPWNPGFNSGGSSGGAAASVAAGMGPLAVGSDAGGSIRIPASFCGVFGFKPSFGRVPLYPGFSEWGMLAHGGPITRTVKDAALTMEVIAGRDDRDRFSLPEEKLSYLSSLDADIKGLRIAWSPDLGYANVALPVLRITESAARTFSGMGCAVEEASPDISSPERAYALFVGLWLGTVLKDKMEQWREEIDQGLLRFIERNQERLAWEFVQASMEQLEFWHKIQPFFEKYDLLLTPTIAVPPLELGQPAVREINGVKVTPLGWMPFTYPFNITGQPSASVPCGWTDDGLPVGLQIVGRRFDDVTVLKAAAAIERALPWANRRPPLD
ncbi:MAG: amidase [Dehalococcoidales bacterium]|nr:amidase [Dehalococcoidales bacterium]